MQHLNCFNIQTVNPVNGIIGKLNVTDVLVKFFIHESLLYKVISSITRNSKRIRSSHYKCKSGLSGSSKKIRPQKGTGKSRQGTCKEIHMRGGAVKFGFSGDKFIDFIRRYKSYNHLNKKEKQLTLFGILADKFRNNFIYLFEFGVNVCINTDSINGLKIFLNVRSNLKEKSICIYKNKLLNNLFSNYFFIKKINCTDINLLDLLYADKVICEKDAFEYLIEKFKKLKKVKEI